MASEVESIKAAFDHAMDAISKFEADEYYAFTVKRDDVALTIQADTNDRARSVRACFGGADWTRKYNKSCGWWEWVSAWNGLNVQIYAIRESPKECKAIIKTRVVKKLVPVAFEERDVEKSVIVGWDCGGNHA